MIDTTMTIKRRIQPTIAVFGEIFSVNLGDGIIYDCVKHLFAVHGVRTIPVDLSGRNSWPDTSPPCLADEKVGLLRKMMRFPMRKSHILRRAYSAFNWYGWTRERLHKTWSNIVRSSDAVVIGGGQLLTDINFGFAPRIYEAARLAKNYGKPLGIFGCGVGTNWGYLATNMYSEVLRYAKFISVRDEISAHALSHHVSDVSKIVIHPDPAFFVAQLAPSSLKFDEGNTIGFNFQPAIHFRSFVPALEDLSNGAYLDFWFKLIKGACMAGHEVIIMTNGDPTDHADATKVAERLLAEGFRVSLEDRPANPAQMLSQYKTLSALICTRMHAGIVAYALGKKVAPISWDMKVDGVWGTVDLGKLVVPPDALLIKDPWPYFSDRISQSTFDSALLNQVEEKIIAASSRCVNTLLRTSKFDN